MDRSAVLGLAFLCAVLSSPFCAGTARAGSPLVVSDALPRFASLSSDKVFWREGPTYDHPVIWIYRRKGLPVEILASYDVWRRVRDADGTVGWVHSSMVSDRRTVVVRSSRPAPLREHAAVGSPVIALLAPGVVGKLEGCDAIACEVSVSGADGWIDKKNIWGVNVGEVFN
jgi:SH3-like domain-containing protein